MKPQTRREFLDHTLRGAVVAGAGWTLMQQNIRAAQAGDIPRRPLGKTGVSVSLVGLGGWHFATSKDPAESTRLVHMAIDRGLDFLDNSCDYHDGESEVRMGNALQGRRDKAFLMTKCNARDKKGALQELERSLKRLKTDYLDLWQFHSIERAEDPDWIFSENGAFEAGVLARQQGKARFIGFTGHKHPDYHLGMLAKPFEWDTVQMPLNVLDSHFRSFQKKVLPVAQKKNLGIIGMKPMAFGGALKVAGAIECLHYAMNLPVSVVVTGCENEERLEQALRAAASFKPLSKTDVAALEEKAKTLGATGEGEPFKLTTDFDNKPPASPPPYA